MTTFTKDEIRILGKQNVKYERALQCVKGVHESGSHQEVLTVKETDKGKEANIACSCFGSGDSCYEIYIKIAKKAKAITEARCSCPYMQKSSKEGDVCKHILAALLKYYCHETQENKSRFDNESIPRNQELSPLSSRRRQLPSWMKQKTDGNECSSKKQKSMALLDTLRAKRTSKQEKFVRRTVYCMTPDEFKKTAQQILEFHKLQEMTKDSLSSHICNEANIANHEKGRQDNIARNERLDGKSELQTLILTQTSVSKRQEKVREQLNVSEDLQHSNAQKEEKTCNSPSTCIVVKESLENSAAIATSCDIFNTEHSQHEISHEEISILDDLL